MKMVEMIKDVIVPLVSVATAVMVGILNFNVNSNDQALRERDQQLDERIGAIDLAVKKSKEEREERESNQNFNIRIYDIVTQSLEEADPRKQAAAKAFVVVMVDEPLRSSLLNVLKQGGDPKVKADISYILEQEEKFQSHAATLPEKVRDQQPTYNWGKWDFDIFWCSVSGSAAQQQAKLIGEQLAAEGAGGRVRIRELPESINAKSGYQISGYAIRKNSNENEVADALKALAEKSLAANDVQATFTLGESWQATPWYVSLFVCPIP